MESRTAKWWLPMKVRTKIHDVELRPAWYFRLAYLEGIVLGMGLLAVMYWLVR